MTPSARERRDTAAHRDADATPTARPQPPIHDYGLVGDGRSVALVARDGSVDWLCWPRFDSPPIFARLVDLDGGSWSIAPTAPARVTRRYVEHTNVLETVFETPGGRVVLTDAMTIASQEEQRRLLLPDHELVRVLRCERGEVELAIELLPRPDFGRARVRATGHPQLGLRWQIGNQLLALHADVPLALDGDGRARGALRLRAGERATFSLTFDQEGPGVLPPLGDHAEERVARSIAWWTGWIARARLHLDGPERELVLRSALALKLMAFAPSGAVIAAPTTSLPERPGGALNWDYRFCWLRDASFTVRALLRLGYVEDAQAFCSWLLHTTRLTRPRLRVLYDVYGNRPPREREIAGVTGYRGALPVRVGNAAARQRQLDCHGEVIDATAQVAYAVGHLDRETRRLLRGFGEEVCRSWRAPDHGIWEPRGPPRHHTHSRLLAWVALDRLIELDDRRLVDRLDRPRLERERAAIREDLERNAWDARQGAYTGVLGDTALDASVLLMSWYGFHPAEHPRMLSTFARVRERLGAGPGLLYRHEDSPRIGEGAFWICGFWAVEHLARGGGTLAEARAWMRAACLPASDLGLMAEEVDPASGAGLGNFPQAYTHVGLIGATLTIAERAARRAEPDVAGRDAPAGHEARADGATGEGSTGVQGGARAREARR